MVVVFQRFASFQNETRYSATKAAKKCFLVREIKKERKKKSHLILPSTQRNSRVEQLSKLHMNENKNKKGVKYTEYMQ